MNVFINNNEFFTDNLTEKLKNKLSDITIKEISIKSDLVNFCTTVVPSNCLFFSFNTSLFSLYK